MHCFTMFITALRVIFLGQVLLLKKDHSGEIK